MRKKRQYFKCPYKEIVGGVAYCTENDDYCLKYCREYKKSLFITQLKGERK